MPWITITYHVDLETGEVITPWLKEYNKIKRLNKKITYNEKTRLGITEYTIGYRRKPEQKRLF